MPEPTTSGTCTVQQDVDIFYEVYGEGNEKVLLVMGLGTSGMAWLNNVHWLVNNSPEYQFCVYDNRGIGRSSVPPGRYTTTVMAQDGIKLADHLGWDRFHLAGISMGGMISQEIALAIPKRIKSLHLSVTHSGGPGSFPPFAGVAGVLKSARAKTPEEKAPIVMDLMYSPEFLSSEGPEGKPWLDTCTQRYLDMVKKLPPINPAGYRSQVLAVNTHSVGKARLASLRNASIPMTIATGTVDKLVNPKASHFLNAQLKPSEFIVWEGCGHGVITQRFDDYNQSLLRCFARGVESAEQPQPQEEAAE